MRVRVRVLQWISAGTVRIRGDEDEGRILPGVENEYENGEHFKWWDKE
ncbi:hypothetical protein A2U01_0081386, partial [Trifolium medium]|nr:hypothetical protein [Trifolium medium]